jgi:hydroxymethylbilane synthase
MSLKPIRLGTRRSHLARAQSQAIAQALEQLHPGLRVELIGIDTRGDQITNIPLSQVEGKEFFTAEIDAALLEGTVDLTVHSYKDLSLERPAALWLGAVPKRENPRDIVLFAPDVAAQIAAGQTLRIGSSSPRRAALVPPFLARALPGAAKVQLCDLRGNVDSRIKRLREPRGSERHMDGVILALAGVARLWRDESMGGHSLLEGLLAGLPRMILPLTQCPGAPAQGALAIECRTDDAYVRGLLAPLDDLPTRAAVVAERALLAARGGGCHQRLGATQIAIEGLGTLLYWREAVGEQLLEPRQEWHSSTPLPAAVAPIVAWDGSRQPPQPIQSMSGVSDHCAMALAAAGAAFIAHRQALPEMTATAVNACRHIWVPGTESWFALAERGVWVEGCAEGLGFASLAPTIAAGALGLPSMDKWLVLTHAAAASDWRGCNVLATYEHQAGGVASGESPELATHIYWHSTAQFERWRDSIGAAMHHACGPGKTAEYLRRTGVRILQVFPSSGHWREWLSK